MTRGDKKSIEDYSYRLDEILEVLSKPLKVGIYRSDTLLMLVIHKPDGKLWVLMILGVIIKDTDTISAPQELIP